MISEALSYAARGWPVFPLHTPAGQGACSCGREACDRVGKHPRTANGLKDASTDPGTIERWWAKHPTANVGLRTGNGLVVVDVDGDYPDFEVQLPGTLTVNTARGRHYYYAGDAASGQNVYGKGIDVRGAGGYVVAPPSLHASGSRYEWANDLPIAPMPVLEPAAKKRSASAIVAASAPSIPAVAPGRKRIARATAWLDQRDPAVQGNDGSTQTLATAIQVLAFVLGDQPTAFRLLSPWNARCQPPWPAEALLRKVSEAAKSDTLPSLMSQREAELVAPRQHGAAGPPIQLGVDIHRVTNECVAALELDETTYQRGGQFVHVADRKIRTMATATLLERLTRIVTFEKYDERSDSWRAAEPPERVVQALYARGEWPGVRKLTGVVEAPSLVGSGTILQRPGYDPESGYLLIPSSKFPVVPEAPQYEDALLALRELDEVFVDFPFAEPTHQSAALAYILTCIARPAIHGPCPAFVVDATTPGTGKSLLTKSVGIIVTGQLPSMTPSPKSEEEWSKLITAWAIEGARLACIDNLRGTVESEALDAVLTAEHWRSRILGSSATVDAPMLAVWSLTGNNVALGGDLARRVVTIRLESQLERPEERTGFAHDQIPWVLAERPRLAVAALTVLRAFVVAGRPLPAGWKPLGTFESWSNLVAAALVWLGRPNPLDGRPAGGGDQDAKLQALRQVLDGLGRLDPHGHGMTAGDILRELWPVGAPPSDRPGHGSLREAIEVICPSAWGRSPTPRGLGSALRAHKRRVVGGRMLDCRADRNGIMTWGVSAGFAGFAGSVYPSSAKVAEGSLHTDHGSNPVQMPVTLLATRPGVTPQTPQTPHLSSSDDDPERDAIQEAS